MHEQRTLIYAFAAGRVAFGAGLLAAPAALGSSWVGDDAQRPAAQVLTRGLGARDIALAAGTAVAAARRQPVRPWLIGTLVCDLADLAATLLAGDGVPARGRNGTVAVVGAAALAGGALLAAVEE